MRTRLASLIIVKQETLSNDDYINGDHETLQYGDDLRTSPLYSSRSADGRQVLLPVEIGDLNNNNNNNNNHHHHHSISKDEFDEDIKCMYIFVHHAFLT